MTNEILERYTELCIYIDSEGQAEHDERMNLKQQIEQALEKAKKWDMIAINEDEKEQKLLEYNEMKSKAERFDYIYETIISKYGWDLELSGVVQCMRDYRQNAKIVDEIRNKHMGCLCNDLKQLLEKKD